MTYLLSSTASRYVFMPVRLGVCGGFTVYWAVSYNTRTKCVPITKAAICSFFFFFSKNVLPSFYSMTSISISVQQADFLFKMTSHIFFFFSCVENYFACVCVKGIV